MLSSSKGQLSPDKDNKSIPVPSSSNTISLRALIPSDYAGLRLDQALSRLFPDYSRSRLQQWLKEERVSVNGSSAKPKTKVWGGESIEMQVITERIEEAHPEDLPLDIVHEDETLIVIDKPPGLVVHPGHGNATGTLMHALLFHAPVLATLPRAGIVHRLDKNTSGLLVIAKTLTGYTSLVRQLQARTVHREYLALVHGMTPPAGKVEAAIGRHPRERVKMAVVAKGKSATTHYRTLAQGQRWSLLQCRLETGRTHQIRVHLSNLGFPLIGDSTYGGKAMDARLPLAARGFPRQALHALRLGLVHPVTGKTVQWQRAAPADLTQLRRTLEQSDPPV